MSSKFFLVGFTVLALFPHGALRAESDDDIVSRAIGVTMAQSVLLAHISVSTLAEAYDHHVYKPDEADRKLNNVIAAMGVAKDELSKLLTVAKFTTEEAKFLSAHLAALDLVTDEAKDLKRYINTGDKSAAEAYEKDRQKIISQINDFRAGKR